MFHQGNIKRGGIRKFAMLLHTFMLSYNMNHTQKNRVSFSDAYHSGSECGLKGRYPCPASSFTESTF